MLTIRTMWAAITVLVALLPVSATPALVAGAEPSTEPEATTTPIGMPARYEDPAGDVPGGAGPDIVAVTVSQPEGPLVSLSVELASEPPLGYDLESWTTDMIWIGLDTQPVTDIEQGSEYVIGVHGADLQEAAETGAHLYDSSGDGSALFWRVVDVAVDGPTVTLTVDRKLIGDPDVMSFFVATIIEGEEEASQADVCPDEPPGEHTLTPSW